MRVKVDSWRGSGWIVATAIALTAESRWLTATSVEYLVLAATATAVAAALSLVPRAESRRWSFVATIALVVAVALTAATQHQLARLQSRWETEQSRMSDDAVRLLGDEVASAVGALRQAATRALDAPPDRGAAFASLSRIADAEGTALVLYRGDSAFAWAGRQHVDADSLTDSVGVAGSGFYLALYVTAAQAGERVVATRLLYALPPADRIAASLSGETARRAGVAGFTFISLSDSAARHSHVIDATRGGNATPLFAAEPILLPQGQVQLRLLERARVVVGVLLAIALAAFIVATWRIKRSWPWRATLVLAGLLCVALAPLSAYSNYLNLFNPAVYFTSLGGPLTANAAALTFTSALVLLLLLATMRRPTRLPGPRSAAAIVILVAGVGPFLLRDLSRGIQIPPFGVSATLWLTWEVPVFLAAVSVILTGAAAGSALVGPSRGLPPAIAPIIAAIAAAMAPVLWQAPAGWPWWYTFLWIAAIASLAVSRRTNAIIVAAATVAALGAMTLVWGATTRARVQLAEQDVAHLGSGDTYARDLAARLVQQLTESPVVTRQSLLQAYATSDLAAAGFPTLVQSWRGDSVNASLATAMLAVNVDSLRALVQRARVNGGTAESPIPASPALAYAIAAATDSGVASVVVAPKSLLIAPDPSVRLLGIETNPRVEPPYSLQAAPVTSTMGATSPGTRWRREGSELHGDWIAPTGSGRARVHVELELRSLAALVQRGTLILLLDLAIVGFLWLTSVLADGIASRWINVRWQRYARSYRVRLTLALFAFFMVPAVAFAVWSYQQLLVDAARARGLLVGEALRSARATPSGPWLAAESRRLATPLLLYEPGELKAASDSLLFDIAPTGRLVDAGVAQALLVQGEVSAQLVQDIAGDRVLFGYRVFQTQSTSLAVLAAPARPDDLALARRARDLGVLVLFATAIGALAALWLSGAAARQLARPIGSLRQAALALAAGEREPQLESEPTAEFSPVFAAFRRMVSDLNASRGALEEAQRRTTTVLRNVASGVIAVDADAAVTLANPRADELLRAPLRPGTRLDAVGQTELAARVREFLAGTLDEAEFETTRGERHWRGRFTRLTRSGGAVITLDDVTEIARAERVLAWGEMARQVAHEIKNPLTPIRLGVQHLSRARADKRVNFDAVLEQNVERILKEIDHLDEIARAFSRYGQPPEQQGGAEPTDVAAILRDLVELESMGGGDEATRWALAGAEEEVLAMGRRDELREVLLNVFENARLARATSVHIDVAADNGRVRVQIADNGHGIPADVLPRIFEPHFSTRTSGSGLGLAISRRVIESWGGRMELESEEKKGTRVSIDLLGAR
jgi:two-component system nitrogen regulation sensor histidine kinase NtrY